MTYLVPQQMYDKYEQYAKEVKSQMRSNEKFAQINEPNKSHRKGSESTAERPSKNSLLVSTTPTADLNIFDTHKPKTGDTQVASSWVAPPPEYGIDPVAYRRVERLSRATSGGGLLSGATLLGQGLVVTPHLIETYASAAEWALYVGGPHALILLPSLAIGSIFRARLGRIKKRTSEKPLALKLRGSEVRKMKDIHRTGKPEHREAMTLQAWEQARKQQSDHERKRADDERARKIAAKVYQDQKLDAAKARELVQAALAEERKAEDAAAQQRARDVAVARENSLATATERHARIREAYTEIITDPLNALEHASLFDVGDLRTSKFVQAYLDVEDLVNDHSGTVPTELVGAYAQQVRDLVRLWDDALDYSTKRSYSWLPENEADMARKAAGLLARSVPAKGEEITPEQILSARKALDLLDKITTVSLPKTARGSIEQIARKEITA